MADSIDINKLNRLMASGETPFLIDVRRKADYEADPKKIAGAVWRDPEEIEDWNFDGDQAGNIPRGFTNSKPNWSLKTRLFQDPAK
jgi:rhodanese-related sulfurtransferase